MKRRRCFRCSRKRPLKKMRPDAPGEPPLCSNDKNCWRAHHRDEAQTARRILSDHDTRDREDWRRILAKHVRRHLFPASPKPAE
jgi:hypothetical protein